MNLFWVINGKQLKKYAILTVAALFTAGVIYIEKDTLSAFSSGSDSNVFFSQNHNEPQAIYSVETDKQILALTFDISWGNKSIAPILEVLEREGVTKATFFLSSPWAEHHPEIVQRIDEMGFEIGSHGHKHENYSHLTDDEIRKQITKSHHILNNMIAETPYLLRTPNGDFDKRVLQIANQLDYTVIHWDTNSKDWINPGVARIVDNVLSKAHPGDIILMHASDSSKQTHEALPIIIDDLRGKGYEFVSVTELITELESSIRESD